MTDNQTVNDECGICLEILTAAVTLPCNHKFCSNCLDGWKSKFGSPKGSSKSKKERSKSCPLCRKKIPPSKDMMMQLKCHRDLKRQMEAKGETTSSTYKQVTLNVKQLEAEIGTYDGKGLDYDGCIEIPEYIYDAVKTNNIKRVMKWLGSPVDKNKLNARDPDHVNATLVHLAVYTFNSGLLSMLLQYGADVNALNANGCNPLMLVATTNGECGTGIEQAKILLEWGTEIILPRTILLEDKDGLSDRNRDALIQVTKQSGNKKLGNLISSEFGGRRCEVINLPNHPQLNGKTCV